MSHKHTTCQAATTKPGRSAQNPAASLRQRCQNAQQPQRLETHSCSPDKLAMCCRSRGQPPAAQGAGSPPARPMTDCPKQHCCRWCKASHGTHASYYRRGPAGPLSVCGQTGGSLGTKTACHTTVVSRKPSHAVAFKAHGPSSLLQPKCTVESDISVLPLATSMMHCSKGRQACGQAAC